jgi:hypothetical protein
MLTGITGDAPLAGLVRLDTDVALLSRRVEAVLAEVDDLRVRMLSAVEAAEHELTHHPRNEAGDSS